METNVISHSYHSYCVSALKCCERPLLPQHCIWFPLSLYFPHCSEIIHLFICLLY